MALERQSPDHHHDFRGMLEARRGQLTAEVERLMARIREHGSQAMQLSDPVEADLCDVDTILIDLANAMLRRVDAALDRLGDGSYGRCRRCGGSIAVARLRAMPFAVRCRPCEAARERRVAAPSTLRKRLWDERPAR